MTRFLLYVALASSVSIGLYAEEISHTDALVSIDLTRNDYYADYVKNFPLSVVNPMPQKDKLKSKSRSWSCETCRDTNSFKRIDKTKTWVLSFDIDDFPTNIVSLNEESKTDNLIISSKNEQPLPPTDEKILVEYEKIDIILFLKAKLAALLKSDDGSLYLSLFFFLLGVVTTVFVYSMIKKYSNLVKSYIDAYIEKLERNCLSLYNEGNYAETVQLLVSSIPFVINYRGANHLDTAAFQHLLAKAYLSLSNIDAAESLLTNVRDIYEPLGRDYHFANVIEDIGTVQYAKQNFDAALEHYLLSLDIHVELLAGTIPTEAESSPGNCFSSTEFNSSKYEEKYRRSLVQKAIVGAKEIFSHEAGQISPLKIETPLKHSEDSECKDKNPKVTEKIGKFLGEAFDLEIEEELAFKELENLLVTPETPSKVSPFTPSPENSPENFVPEGVPVGTTASDLPTSPDTARLHHLIGKVLFNQKRFQTASEYFVTALDMFTALQLSAEVVNEVKADVDRVSQILNLSSSTPRRRVRFSPDASNR